MYSNYLFGAKCAVLKFCLYIVPEHPKPDPFNSTSTNRINQPKKNTALRAGPVPVFGLFMFLCCWGRRRCSEICIQFLILSGPFSAFAILLPATAWCAFKSLRTPANFECESWSAPVDRRWKSTSPGP